VKILLGFTLLLAFAFSEVTCPLAGSAPLAITITDGRLASPGGGISFVLAGQGFTPNGPVNVRLFNVAHQPAALDLSNAPGAPALAANANGNFSGFRVAVDCTDPEVKTGPNGVRMIVTDPPQDVYLYAYDVNSQRVAINTFHRVSMCLESISNFTVPNLNCGGHQPPCK
jgi:hypothetical protein